MPQASQQTLKEAVDGRHGKVVVVVDKGAQRLAGLCAQRRIGGDAHLFPHSGGEVALHALCEVAELRDDTRLHFRRRRIGKRHGQQAAMRVLAAAKQQSDVFGCERERLARASGGAIYFQGLLHKRRGLINSASAKIVLSSYTCKRSRYVFREIPCGDGIFSTPAWTPLHARLEFVPPPHGKLLKAPGNLSTPPQERLQKAFLQAKKALQKKFLALAFSLTQYL